MDSGTSTSYGPSTEKDAALIQHVRDSYTPVPWCDEFEKMISGMSFDERSSLWMLQHQHDIRKLLTQFNDNNFQRWASFESLKVGRLTVLKQVVGHLGSDCSFNAPFYCTYGCNISIGDRVYANRGLTIYDSAPVIIGSRVHFGPNVSIRTESHAPFTPPATAGLLYARPVMIHDNCWIGENVTIMLGVIIGKGCSIMAGSVVLKDIPAFSLAGGIPARVMTYEVEDKEGKEDKEDHQDKEDQEESDAKNLEEKIL